MTINQALDKLLKVKELNLAQQDLRHSLKKFKREFGGLTKIDNVKQVNNIIQYGDKEGKQEF